MWCIDRSNPFHSIKYQYKSVRFQVIYKPGFSRNAVALFRMLIILASFWSRQQVIWKQAKVVSAICKTKVLLLIAQNSFLSASYLIVLLDESLGLLVVYCSPYITCEREQDHTLHHLPVFGSWGLVGFNLKHRFSLDFTRYHIQTIVRCRIIRTIERLRIENPIIETKELRFSKWRPHNHNGFCLPWNDRLMTEYTLKLFDSLNRSPAISIHFCF